MFNTVSREEGQAVSCHNPAWISYTGHQINKTLVDAKGADAESRVVTLQIFRHAIMDARMIFPRTVAQNQIHFKLPCTPLGVHHADLQPVSYLEDSFWQFITHCTTVVLNRPADIKNPNQLDKN